MNTNKIDPIRQEDLSRLEAHLAGTLRPVQPPKDLVRRLRTRIRFPKREQIMRRFRDWRSLFLALGSVLSGMLLLMTLGRALYYFFGRRGA